MTVTRDQLLATVLTTATSLRRLAELVGEGIDHGAPADWLQRELLENVDRLRHVLPEGSELTIDQRPLF